MKENNFPNHLNRTLEFDITKASNLQLLKINPNGPKGCEGTLTLTNQNQLDADKGNKTINNGIYFSYQRNREEVNQHFLNNLNVINQIKSKHKKSSSTDELKTKTATEANSARNSRNISNIDMFLS